MSGRAKEAKKIELDETQVRMYLEFIAKQDARLLARVAADVIAKRL